MLIQDKNSMAGPLKGIRIVDLSRVLSGPLCTMILADMGAEVIKVEEPSTGDDTRGFPPFLRGFSAYYANLNRNKKSVTLNLKKPQAVKILLGLIKEADVLVENYKPGTMEKLGLSYEVIRRQNPQIIFASVSVFGQYGPYKDRPGYDIIAQAMGGLMSVTGWSDSLPTRAGTAIGDILGGLNCCIGILAALKSRDTTGKGQQVDVALVDSVVSAMQIIIQIYLSEGRIPQRLGNRFEFIYPNDSFPAQDGLVVIAVGNDKIWERFCQAIGREELLDREEYKTNSSRTKEYASLKQIITEWTSTKKMNDIIELMLANSVPCAPIYDTAQVVNDPHIAEAREMLVEIDHPLEGKMKVVGCPWKFSETKATIRTPAPMLGQHTAEVLADILKVSATEYEILKENGAIG